jgi:L-ascorbate metabolism protein UlaG (beta-lactamase superfamily)
MLPVGQSDHHAYGVESRSPKLDGKVMHRRLFIHRTRQWLILAAAALFAPRLIKPNLGWTARAENIDDRLHSAASLQKMAAQKLHHLDDGFRNLFSPGNYGDLGRLLRWKWFSKNHFKQLYADEPERPVDIDWRPAYDHDGLSVTYINHASLLIRDQGVAILVDPVLDGLFGMIKDFTPLSARSRQIPKVDYLLITHGHYDHLDKPSIERCKHAQTRLITPLGYDTVFDGLKVGERTQLDWFEHVNDGRRTITLLPSRHWTMRNPLVGPNRSLWGGFLIETASGPTIYLSGDTAYHDRFSEIGAGKAIDLAVFSLGAYEPRWFMAQSHLNPAETFEAFRETGARRLMIVHWGTFRLGDEPVHYPPLQMRAVMERAGLLDRYLPLSHGETYRLA